MQKYINTETSPKSRAGLQSDQQLDFRNGLIQSQFESNKPKR